MAVWSFGLFKTERIERNCGQWPLKETNYISPIPEDIPKFE